MIHTGRTYPHIDARVVPQGKNGAKNVLRKAGFS